MRKIPVNKKYLTACMVVALMVCITQILGYTLLIEGCLLMFMALIVWCCTMDFTLPILLFFLAWSPVLKINPTGYSFYTFGLITICLISVVKKGFNFRNYQLISGILIFGVTLFSKLLDGNFLSMDYVAFLMMIVLFPSVKEEWRKNKYDFYQLAVFLSLGVVLASLCALFFADLTNLRRFVKVAAYQSIIRRSGFYGDANFYTAHITAALGGVLALLIQEEKKGRLAFLGILATFLFYCGSLSGSKSFVLVSAVILLIWVIAVLKMRGKVGLKVTLLFGLILIAIFIASSALFSDLIQVLLTRFASTKDLRSFTTGRTDLWMNYIQEILSNAKVFFLGWGFTNVKLDGRGSHNTIIQILFQFGLIGSPILGYWTSCFFRDAIPSKRKKIWPDLKNLMVCMGAFVPWLAIDALFFDEFFLMQWYMLTALNYFRSSNEEIELETGSYGGYLWTRK